MNTNRIKGKIAFISGASSGIGRAVAEKLAQMGANLILCARRAEVLAQLKDQVAALSVEMAQKVMMSELSDEKKQTALINDYLKGVTLN